MYMYMLPVDGYLVIRVDVHTYICLNICLYIIYIFTQISMNIHVK
jgi:hypothetical protein